MTSLYPGLLFYSTGLNRKSTPAKAEATPSEIDAKLGRTAFNGKPWPKSSPVSAVYDVRNSSTRMIILNNKLSRRPKGSRLRGQTDHRGDIQAPEPNRHIQEEPKTNVHNHKHCQNSDTEKFVPKFPPSVTPTPQWVNNQQRPPMRFDNGSLVNPNHHIHCQGHMDYDIMRWYSAQRTTRPKSRGMMSSRDEEAMYNITGNPGLKPGEKRYMTSIASIYSVSNMKAIKQEQYREIMWKEINKGFKQYQYKDIEKYNRYLNTNRKTQYGVCDPNRDERSISAPPPKRPGQSADGDSRPCTTQTARGPPRNRSPMTPGTVSNRSGRSGRSSERPLASLRSSERPLASVRSSERPTGRKAVKPISPYLAKKTSKPGKGAPNVNNKPARHESPLPLQPRNSSPSPSMSDISSVGEPEEYKRSEVKKSSPKTPPAPAPEPTSQRSDDPTPRAGEEPREGAEVKVADEDERSKMSARDVPEQRGNSLEYRQTFGDPNDERSRETDKETDKETDSPKSSDSKKESYKPSEVQQKESSKDQSSQQTKEDDLKLFKTTHSTEGGQSVDEKSTEVSKSEKDNSEKDKSEKDNSEKDNSDGFEGAEDLQHSHREGKDRPLSRLGGREQFQVVKKVNFKNDNENSDDDYSDDEETVVGSKSKQPADKGDLNQASADVKADTQATAPATDPPQDRVSESSTNPTEKSSPVAKGQDTGSQGSGGQGADTATPTEASSEQKASDISTIEY